MPSFQKKKFGSICKDHWKRCEVLKNILKNFLFLTMLPPFSKKIKKDIKPKLFWKVLSLSFWTKFSYILEIQMRQIVVAIYLSMFDIQAYTIFII